MSDNIDILGAGISVPAATPALQESDVFKLRCNKCSQDFEIVLRPLPCEPRISSGFERVYAHTYPCGCSASGSTLLPTYCPDHKNASIERYSVEADKDGAGDWHILTFADGHRVQILTQHPLVIVDAETH